ncbi:hypothetical protein ERJ75_001098000 [Trypanosoma vivax]|nr:hypothetical protein TRVL_06256 [Trypanosoma vivax]KAH8610485.1 hypothetical protein ERJ75_001098000 [Trypanosoma vivax]
MVPGTAHGRRASLIKRSAGLCPCCVVRRVSLPLSRTNGPRVPTRVAQQTEQRSECVRLVAQATGSPFSRHSGSKKAVQGGSNVRCIEHSKEALGAFSERERERLARDHRRGSRTSVYRTGVYRPQTLLSSQAPTRSLPASDGPDARPSGPSRAMSSPTQA